MNKSLIVLSVLAVFVFGVVAVTKFTTESRVTPAPDIISTDHKNATYTMPDGTKVTLQNGVAEIVLDNDVAVRVVVRYFGNELHKDVDGDGLEDVVFLLTEERGGSGTYFYVVAALKTPIGYAGSQATLIGDRIAPQTIESGEGRQVIVNYAERVSGEPMTTVPSVGKSLHLILDPVSLMFGEVAADFEGEANPEQMTLDMKTWVWQKADYNDGRTVVPTVPDRFTLTFSPAGEVAIGTDCNSVGGEYEVEGGQLVFKNLRSTRMYCEGSEETEFVSLLQNTTGFHFTSRGELILSLKFDSGTVSFR